jgi:FAD synthase
VALAASAMVCVVAAAMLEPAAGSPEPGHPGRNGRHLAESNPSSFLRYATGPVFHGEGRGKKLGFPTANIDFDPAAPIPQDGVYAGRFTILERPDPDDARPFAEPLPALVSIGSNVTFDATTQTIEAYILDFDEDIYGCRAEVSVEWFIRPQIKFETVDDLIAQINQDEVRGREYFQSEKTRGDQ